MKISIKKTLFIFLFIPSLLFANINKSVELSNSGDIDGAVEILNSMLIENPLDLEARFLRAKILTLSGQGDLVIGDLKALLTLDINPSDKKEIEGLIAIIEGVTKKSSNIVYVEVGVTHSDNVNGWSKDGKSTAPSTGNIVDLPASIYGGKKAYEDETYNGKIGLSGTYQISQDKNYKIFYSASQSGTQSQDTVNKENTSTSFSSGLILPTDYVDFTLGLSYRNADKVNYHTNSKNQVTNVNSDVKTNTYFLSLSRIIWNSKLSYTLAFANNDYSGLSNSNNSDSETMTNSLRYNHQLGKNASFGLSTSLTDSDNKYNTADAKRSANKDIVSYGTNLNYKLTRNQEIKLSYSLSNVEYDITNTIAGKVREDDTTSIKIDYTLQLGAFSKIFDGYSVNTFYKQSDSSSNQRSGNRQENQFGLSVKKVWSF